MKKILVITLFMLATLAWAAAQQPGSTPDRSSGQATSPEFAAITQAIPKPEFRGWAGPGSRGVPDPGIWSDSLFCRSLQQHKSQVSKTAKPWAPSRRLLSS